MLTQPGRAMRPAKARCLQEQAPPALKQMFTAALGSSSCCCPSRLASGAPGGCPSFCQGPALLLSPFPRAKLAGEEDALLVLVPTHVSFPARLEGPSLCLAASWQLLRERCCELGGSSHCSAPRPSVFPTPPHFCLSGQDRPPPAMWVSHTNVLGCASCRAACAPCPGSPCLHRLQVLKLPLV